MSDLIIYPPDIYRKEKVSKDSDKQFTSGDKKSTVATWSQP